MEDLKKHATEQGVRTNCVAGIVHALVKNKWIEPIKRGIYAFTLESGMSESPHEFEVAQVIAKPSAISHWTAMHYHQLTQQTPNTVFSITTKRAFIPERYQGRFHYKLIENKQFFGVINVWIGNARIQITDLEKTLLDGLSNPELCGGFSEVYNAFVFAKKIINLDKIVNYALQTDDATVKRLGWILEKLGFPKTRLERLKKHPMKGFRKLDPKGAIKGPYDQNWQLRLNA
ncbi:MAG: hypothetical protein H7A40_06925 [Chlamydiales bacterium]|nr:hypothetical protein [Chlamydiales bacterium]